MSNLSIYENFHNSARQVGLIFHIVKIEHHITQSDIINENFL